MHKVLTHSHAVSQAGDGLLKALRFVQSLHVAAQHGLAHLALGLDYALQQQVREDALHRC